MSLQRNELKLLIIPLKIIAEKGIFLQLVFKN